MSALEITQTVAVIGAGTMGAGVAQVAAAAGHPVLLFDVGEGAARKGCDQIGAGLEKQVARGRMSAADREALLNRIQVAATLEDLAPAALVIEAIVENLAVKQELFTRLESLCGPDTILASNTSSLSITAIGAALARPQQLVGMHFFNPAPIMKLVEVIRGLATDETVAETVFATATAWGKQAVLARSTPGFIVNRVARPFYAEGLRVLQEGGADAATLDAVMRECGGFRMGPFELMDLIGHDVNYAVTCSVHSAYYGDPRFTPSLIQKELVDAGFLGRKSGRGFFVHGKEAAAPVAQTATTFPAPQQVQVLGDAPFAETLIRLMQAAGITVETEARNNDEDFVILAGEAMLALTDGRTATECTAADELENLVLFDLALDYADATRIALAGADQTSRQALEDAIGLWQAMGKQVSILDDIPGMLVMRTVCMLANEGADAVNQQVCSIAAVDTAMQGGVNYPLGPMAWAERIGVGRVATVLDNLAGSYGEDRYRASPLLVRRAITGGSFHD
ncbi:MAG: 3-hydroxyacyl-CoA dehydrogenase PaaC [Thiothrix sp.]|nr:3-hydroxyacyl-CoA dehydrogenase PaaC [Thiothrix sp.]